VSGSLRELLDRSHESLRLELAGRRKETHTEDALRVYRDRIEPTIARKTRRDDYDYEYDRQSRTGRRELSSTAAGREAFCLALRSRALGPVMSP
jgi:hypothetical protein